MKIKAVIVTKDETYLARLKSRLSAQYSSKIQASFFTETEKAAAAASDIRPHLFVVDEDLSLDDLTLPKRCSPVCLISDQGIRSVGGMTAICKYQSTASFLGDLLDAYTKQAEENSIQFESRGASRKKIISFFPGAGGVGSSTLAAAFAVYLAKQNERVLYLNLEQFGTADLYFRGNEKNSFDKVLFALQMDNSGTPLKLENALNRDASGVYFYAGSTSALDMHELDDNTMELLFERLSQLESFDWIVVDMDTTGDQKTFGQIARSFVSVFVSDGSAAANYKLKRLSDAIEHRSGDDHSGNLLLMYNRFSSKTSSKADDTIFTEAGGIGRIENASIPELVQIISQNGVFRELAAY